MRVLVAATFAALVCSGLAASAQKAPEPAAGRFAIMAEGDGFLRLDTRSGAVSHCRKNATGAWTCVPFNEADTALRDEIAALSRRIAALSGELDALASDVARLQRRIEGTAPPAPDRGARTLSETDQAELDRALGFMETVMRRFFTMVEEMKRPADTGSTGR